MARRRVNKRFLIILGTIVFMLVGAGVAYKVLPIWFPQIKWLVRGTPQSHVNKAKELFALGDFKEAGESYKRAISYKGSPDSDMYTGLGDCYIRLVAEDEENLRYAKQCWDMAVANNPQHTEALHRLLELFSDDAEMNRSLRTGAQQWLNVQETADKILKVNPNDREARLAYAQAVIQRWGAGVETNQVTIDDAIARLQALSTEQPFMPDAWFFLWQSQVLKAVDRLKVNDRSGATAMLDETRKSLEETLTAHPDDALLYYRAARMLLLIGAADRQQNQPPKYTERVKELAAKASDLAKPDAYEFADMKMMQGKLLEQSGDVVGAEKVYRSGIELQPTSVPLRMLLAELIGRDPARRDEAISLLETLPAPSPEDVRGLRALLRKRLEIASTATLVNIKLDALQTTRDRATFDRLVTECEQGHKTLVSQIGENPTTLQILGRIQMAKGDNVAAVQTLQRALDLIGGHTSLSEYEQKYKLMYLLARANIQVNQTAKAEQLLSEIVKDFPKFYPARLELAQLLVDRRAMDEARVHAAVLSRELPNSPFVQRLEMALLDKTKPEDKAKLDALYAKIPEGTPAQAVEKAQIALAIDNKPEALRLLSAAHTAVPDDPNLTIALARLYRDMNQADKGLALVRALAAKRPDLTGLKVLEAELAGSENVAELRREAIEQLPDPLRRELALYQLERREGRPEEAKKHLEAAVALKPDDPGLMSVQFEVAINSGDIAKAEALVEPLAKANQDQAEGAFYRIQLAIAKGQASVAEDLATQLTRSRAEFAQSWVMLGEVQLAMKKYPEATQNFTEALARQAQNREAILGLIRCGYATNQPVMAKRYIDQGRKIFPNNPELRELDLNHELRFGNPENAIAPREQVLQQAIDAKSPAEAEARLQLAATYVAVAKTKGNAGRPFLEKARDTLSKGMQQWPDSIAFAEQLAGVYAQLKNVAEGEKVIQALAARDAWKGKPEPVLLLSAYYTANGKTDAQEKLLRDYLAASPNAVPIQVQLAALLAQKKQIDEALKVTAGNADNPAIQKFRIELQIDAGRLPEAEKEIAALLAATPNPSPSLLSLQAFVYSRSGRPTEAVAVLDRILAIDSRNIEALYLRASIFINASVQKELDRSIQDMIVVRDALSSADSKRAVDARILLAQAYLLKGDEDGAMRELEASVRSAPEHVDSRIFLARLYAQTKPPRWPQAERLFIEARDIPAIASNLSLQHEEALMWLKRKEPEKARDLMRKVLPKAATNVDFLRTYVQALYDSKDYRPLLSETDAMAKSRKAPYWLYQYRGRAQKALDDKPAALEEFSTALEVASAAQDDNGVAAVIATIADDIGIPAAKARIAARAEQGDPRWRIMMAYLCQGEDDIATAITWMDRVLADESKLSPAMANLALRMVGTMYLRLDPPDLPKAIGVYQKLIERDPKDVAALNNLACTMILPNSGYTAKDALVHSQKALDVLAEVGQNNPYIDDTHGYNLVLSGRFPEGMALIQQAIDRKPDFIEAHYHLGEAYLAMPQPQPAEAQQALQQAMTLLEKASRDEKPVDSTLKSKIEKALERAKQPPPA